MHSPLHERQFQRAIGRGAISILRDELKNAIFVAYEAIGAANQQHRRVAQDVTASSLPVTRANNAMKNALPHIRAARDALLGFLTEDEAPAPPPSPPGLPEPGA